MDCAVHSFQEQFKHLLIIIYLNKFQFYLTINNVIKSILLIKNIINIIEKKDKKKLILQ